MKKKELSSQFIAVLTGKPYQPAMINTNVAAISVAVINPAVGSSQQPALPAAASVPTPDFASPASPSSLALEEMARKLQLLE